jgi:glutamine amidotransferase
MVRKAGGRALVLNSPEGLSQVDRLILPGVGSFDIAARALRDSGWAESLARVVYRGGKPYLGICLGMQLLFENSEEGQEPGLGWFQGSVKRFRFDDPTRKVPHMGWNQLLWRKPHPLFENLDDKARFYFVHSYRVDPDHSERLCLTRYGTEFTSGVMKDNIVGLQFHPEKSHRFGLEILRNFLKLH